MPSNGDSETVAEILTRKKGTIKNAPLGPGSPSWNAIAGETWISVKRKARRRVTGYRTIKKLLLDGRFDRK